MIEQVLCRIIHNLPGAGCHIFIVFLRQRPERNSLPGHFLAPFSDLCAIPVIMLCDLSCNGIAGIIIVMLLFSCRRLFWGDFGWGAPFGSWWMHHPPMGSPIKQPMNGQMGRPMGSPGGHIGGHSGYAICAAYFVTVPNGRSTWSGNRSCPNRRYSCRLPFPRGYRIHRTPSRTCSQGRRAAIPWPGRRGTARR